MPRNPIRLLVWLIVLIVVIWVLFALVGNISGADASTLGQLGL